MSCSTGCTQRFVVAAETPEDDLSCSEKSRCPRSQTFSSASHGTSVLILLDLTWPLFVFLHRVIYLLVMRSKTLSGHSDNQPTFRVAENMPLPPAGLCCVRRFCLISLSREIILEWMWKHRRTCDYFPCVRKKYEIIIIIIQTVTQPALKDMELETGGKWSIVWVSLNQ